MVRAYLIRTVEEKLLQLFAAGRLSGTTHTCIGQELSAIALADALDPERDVIFSNHRCHGHYIAWTDDVEGLIAEVMGKRTGVCGGIGGSQHLCGRRFYSNGVQGGIVPVAAGIAFAHKLAGSRAITAVCIGDGTLGEGVVYETLNIAARWSIPLLVVLEDNGYAQSTRQSETLAGSICARAAAFGLRTFETGTWEVASMAHALELAAAYVRSNSAPAFVRIDTYRLAAHSKGDDDRDAEEIASFARRDPLNVFLASDAGAAAAPLLAQARGRVERAVELAAADVAPRAAASDSTVSAIDEALRPVAFEDATQLASLNRALASWLADDPHVLLLGEDIRSPYGGAFKVTRGLSDAFPQRVLNCPISEAAIVGIGNGLALQGFRPVVEVMFGDFITLCFDQIVNHAAKFNGMYQGRASAPIVVRAPMGGGRGYGPTHSQNLEKHLAGTPGMTLLVLHGRVRVRQMFDSLRACSGPVVLIENKLLYRERGDAALPPGYRAAESGGGFPTTVLSPPEPPDITIVAFGRMSLLAEQVAAELARSEEIQAELVFPLQVSPLDIGPILAAAARTGRVLVVEEGAAGFDLAAEVIATLAVSWRGARPLFARRIAARAAPIPSSPDLEREALPQPADVRTACLELFDA